MLKLYTNIITIIRNSEEYSRAIREKALVNAEVLYEEPVKTRFVQFIDPIE